MYHVEMIDTQNQILVAASFIGLPAEALGVEVSSYSRI